MDEFHLTLLPGALEIESKHVSFYNECFSYWKRIWSHILVDDPMFSDSFRRQNIICALSSEAGVVGLIACSFFRGKDHSTFDTQYFHPFVKAGFQPKSNTSLMSIEYLSVDKSLRKGNLGFSLGSVLLGIGMKVYESSKMDFCLGTARSKINVDKMCYSFGFKPEGTCMKAGHPCTLIVNNQSQLTRHPDKQVDFLVQDLWKERINLTNYTYLDATDGVDYAAINYGPSIRNSTERPKRYREPFALGGP
ncbi:MAG: hypothetical protein HRU19_26960 [Pseudobacteriovorax sp.]|nr:hypothetical protein [Pseudobacteriovorax sp.]